MNFGMMFFAERVGQGFNIGYHTDALFAVEFIFFKGNGDERYFPIIIQQ
jgi:hypothetical protein